MNDIIFSKSFVFNHFERYKYSYTDSRSGCQRHFFAFMEKGTSKIVSDKGSIDIKEGDIFYIPNQCRYQSYWHGDIIAFDSLGFKFMPNFESQKFILQVIPSTKEEIALIKKLATAKPVDYNSVSDFYKLVSLLIPKMKREAKNRNEQIIENVKTELYLNYNAKISQVAKKCNISESALYDIFKKCSDITPNELRQKILIDKARELLITTDKPVEEISQLLQFSSGSYFRKIFKKHTGTTPREIRKSTML